MLAELAETKVPGEPLHQSTESGWRPYLPLVDDVISSLNQVFTSRPTRFYTSEGVTELQPPANPIRKLSAYLRLTWSFSHYARLRNWQEDSGDDPQQYLHAIERLGFQISFAPHQEPGAKDDPEDPAVRRFFPCLIPFAATDWLQRVEDWFSRFFNYFGSVFESRIPELIIFLFVAMLFFFGRHWYLN